MIVLTRLSGECILVNAHVVESVESCPDTRIALLNGKQLYVRETPDEIRAAMHAWLCSLAGGGWHVSCGEHPGPVTKESS